MLYIRTDMNAQIATGHIMRCLAIADAAKELGEQVTFILADCMAVNLLEERGYEYIVLDSKWNQMEKELAVLKQVINRYEVSCMLVDSYQVTYKYLDELSKCVRLIYLDDLNMFPYPVADVICYANYWKKFNYSADNEKGTKFYLGTKFVPLRSVFWNCEKKHISETIEKVLILSGGSDPYDAISKILESIERPQYKEIYVICGIYNERYEKLCQLYGQEKNVFVYQGVTDIEKYMKKVDVAISAGGTTLYELCACGTPTISYSFADNQLNNVKQFDEDGIIPYAGDVRYEDISLSIRNNIKKMMNDVSLRQAISDRMQMLVDGKGAMRIASQICK